MRKPFRKAKQWNERQFQWWQKYSNSWSLRTGDTTKQLFGRVRKRAGSHVERETGQRVMCAQWYLQRHADPELLFGIKHNRLQVCRRLMLSKIPFRRHTGSVTDSRCPRARAVLVRHHPPKSAIHASFPRNIAPKDTSFDNPRFACSIVSMTPSVCL